MVPDSKGKCEARAGSMIACFEYLPIQQEVSHDKPFRKIGPDVPQAFQHELQACLPTGWNYLLHPGTILSYPRGRKVFFVLFLDIMLSSCGR